MTIRRAGRQKENPTNNKKSGETERESQTYILAIRQWGYKKKGRESNNMATRQSGGQKERESQDRQSDNKTMGIQKER